MPTQQNLANVTISSSAHNSIIGVLNDAREQVEAVATQVPDGDTDNLFRLGEKRQMFDQLCDTNMHQFPATKPAEVDLALYDSDGDSITKLRAYEALLNGMLTRVQGAIALHGSDRMDADMIYFNYLRFGKRTGMANAGAIFDQIAPHYPTGRGPRTTAPAKNPA